MVVGGASTTAIGAVSRRQAVARATVARRLIAAEVGERIPTVAQLAAEAGTGTGTVQAALKALDAEGAVTLTRHGHQGTVLVERDLGLLWRAFTPGPVTGILPLPGSIEFSGLATAVADAFERAGVPLALAFRLGSRKRVDFLTAGGADFIACSLAYARTLDTDVYRAIDLGPSTYYTRNSVAVITRAGEQPAPRGRVAIDRQSHDHEARTMAEFPEAELIECAYPQIPELVVGGQVDAAVWHRTSASPLTTATGLDVHSLTRPSPDFAEELSRAALVASDEGSPAFALLGSLVEADALAAVQREVVDSRRVPSF